MKTKRYVNLVSPIEMQDLDLKIIKRVDGDTLIPEQPNLIHNIIEGDTLEITFSKNSERFWQVVNRKQLIKSKIFKMLKEPIITSIKPLISSLDLNNSQTDQAYIYEKQRNNDVLPIDHHNPPYNHQQQLQQLSISAQNGQLYQFQPVNQGATQNLPQFDASLQNVQGIPPIQQGIPQQTTTQQVIQPLPTQQEQTISQVPNPNYISATAQNPTTTQVATPQVPTPQIPTQVPTSQAPFTQQLDPIQKQVVPPSQQQAITQNQSILPNSPQQTAQQAQQIPSQLNNQVPNVYVSISPRLNKMTKKYQKYSQNMKYRPFHKKKFRFEHLRQKILRKKMHFRFIKTKEYQEYITYVFKPQFQELGGVKSEDYTTKIIFGKFEEDGEFCDKKDPVISVDVQVKYHKQHFT